MMRLRPGAQLARGLAADVAEPVDDGLHPRPGLLGHQCPGRLITFETVPTDTPATPGHVLDAHRLCHRAGTSRETGGGSAGLHTTRTAAPYRSRSGGQPEVGDAQR